ncbi:L,D-transpeptidase family protein [uncultured Paludibaculum sp.]|uniref:L,D-transpeptidase family protein n=1 Tax=uncultured Paludibaculum sp. TaxID=1765020 RepID=UPI002AAB5592|nr:L,D-transpeptidase family protein [uncultured Paludibaculum sp.]
MTRRVAIQCWFSGLLALPFRLRAGEQADRVLINKARREMLLLKSGKVLKTYRVALGQQPVGPKVQEGDMRTPEGLYRIDGRYAKSQFHRALHISYPSAADRARAQRLGVKPGSAILIHGLPNGQGSVGKDHVKSDWTWGCIAVTDEEIEEIWRMVPDGAVVEIRP